MKNYIVTGMGCAACQARVENAVTKLPGVESVSVSLLTNSMNVEGEATDEVIIKAVEEAGYGIKRSEENSVDSITTVKESIEDNESDLLIKRLKLSLAFLLILMYITMGHNMLKFPIPEILEKNHIALAFVQMALALTVMVINKAFFVNGFKTLFTGHPNMDTLVALGSSISFAWSLFSIYEMTIVKTNADLMDIYHNQLYFESAAMIPALITVGKLLESISKGKTTDALKNLVKMAPKDACVERDGEILKVDISEVNVGDIVVIKPGDAIPVDGSVVNGESTVDESLLTGESVAVKVSIGDNVHATTINLSGNIKVKVTHIGEETAFSKIVKLVKEASGSKAPIARVADKVSGIFVPAVILIALVVLVIWIALGESVAYAIERAVCVLVISCPCALGLATPVAIMVGTGKGAKNGILFKSGEALENVCRADIVVLDKTGTVTEPASNVIKEDSAYAVNELKNIGLEVIMLSGDKEEAANAIAKEVGINEVIAGVLPDGKEAVVREVMKRGKVVMVGDGINDAPALVRADVGIAIGNGTDVAIDSADIVVMNSHLTDVLKSMRLSKRVLRTIHENLFWAFAYNVLLIPLAAGIYSGIQMNPMWGALAMSLSSFTVCMNALRINRYKL